VQPTVQHNGANAVTVNWVAPVGGGPVTSYSVTSSPSVTPPAGCTNVNALTCSFTGLQQGQAYTFTVTAHGPLGDTAAASPSASITAGPPGVPAAPTVALTSNTGEVQVSWTPPNAGAGIASYSVVSDPAVGPPAACTNDAASPCLFTGLDPTVEYRFKVKANGAVVGGQPTGDSDYSALSNPITAGAPNAPSKPTVTVTGLNTVHVDWDAPIGGGRVATYTVASSPSVGAPSGCVNTTATECDFSGLTGGQTYTFTVTANGPLGNTAGSPSDQVTVGNPAAPGKPGVQLGGPNTVTVSWAPSSAGGQLTGYTVVASPAATAPAGCVNTQNNSCEFSGLESGVEYTFSVVAHGLFGNVPSASSSDPITPGPPGAPSKPTVQLTDKAGEVRVSWDAPTLAGAGIDHYVVISSPEVQNPGGCTDVQPNDDTVECTFTGLDRNVAYTFQVKAVGAGNSGESELGPESELIIPNPSGAPGNVHVAAGDRQIAVSWTAPDNVGLGIDSYTARAYGQSLREPLGSCGTDNTGTDCVITGLTNLTSYRVIVFADGPGGTVQAPASEWVRPSAGLPGPPTAVRATPLNQSARITWTAPAAIGNGIAHYTATATPGGRSCITANGTTLACTIEELTNGVTYTVTVVAIGVGASGNSSPSTPPVTVVPAQVPAVPTVTAVIPGTSNLTVRFTPGDGGGSVSNYTATATGGPSSGPCTTANPSVTPCVISGVRPGTAYTVTVVANGAGGVNSAPSTPYGPVTAVSYAAPTLPTGVPPTSGPLTSSAGTTLSGLTTVSGNGYAPFTGITVGIYPGPTVLGTAITDSTGAFSLQVSVAGQGVGAKTLVAAGMRSTGTVRYRNLAVTVTAPAGASRASLAATPAPANGGSRPVVVTQAVPADGRNRTPSRG